MIMIPKFPFFLTLILGGFTAWLWLNDHVMRSVSVIVQICPQILKISSARSSVSAYILQSSTYVDRKAI